MSFKQFLISKRKLLVIWFSIHTFALFINYFEIDNTIILKSYRRETHISVFSTSSGGETTEFWPFVDFYTHYTWERQVWDGVSWYSVTEHRYNFNGIFYKYDISEFIAYSIAIFLFLFFKFEQTNKSTK